MVSACDPESLDRRFDHRVVVLGRSLHQDIARQLNGVLLTVLVRSAMALSDPEPFGERILA